MWGRIFFLLILSYIFLFEVFISCNISSFAFFTQLDIFPLLYRHQELTKGNIPVFPYKPSFLSSSSVNSPSPSWNNNQYSNSISQQELEKNGRRKEEEKHAPFENASQRSITGHKQETDSMKEKKKVTSVFTYTPYPRRKRKESIIKSHESQFTQPTTINSSSFEEVYDSTHHSEIVENSTSIIPETKSYEEKKYYPSEEKQTTTPIPNQEVYEESVKKPVKERIIPPTPINKESKPTILPKTPSPTKYKQSSLFNSTKEKQENDSLKQHQQSNDTIYFFPWEDKQAIDYNLVCSSLLSILQSFHGPPIVSVGKYGGIGHVSVSIYHGLLYALLLQRPFYLSLKPLFWKHTNSCLKSLQYSGKIEYLTPCDKSNNCFLNKQTVTSLIKKPVALYDSRLHWSALFTEKNLRVIQSLFYNKVKFQSWKQVKRLFFRITLNPSPQLISVILHERQQLGKYEGLVGAHVRCGGNLADSHEGVYWIDKQGLDRVQFTFRKALKKMKLPRKEITVYLATDSSYAEETLRRTMAVKIVTLNQVTRGHTTGSSADSVYQSAIVDLFLVSQASVVIYSHTSGFSEAILSMANAKREYILPFDKHIPK